MIDLGKDVPPETVAEKVVETHAPLLGLSALMTTTVVNMEETISQVRKVAPWCKIVVGGAVLTKEYGRYDRRRLLWQGCECRQYITQRVC